MKLYFYIFLGGGVGSLARFIISVQVAGALNTLYPVGTAIVNLAGALLVGIFIEMFNFFVVSAEMRSFLLIGFLGGFTTFSTFVLENSNLLRNGEYKFFWINIISQNILGMFFVFFGIFLAKFMIKVIR